MDITKSITTTELRNRFKENLQSISKENVSLSNNNNVIIYLDGEWHVVYHNSQKIPSTETLRLKKTEFKEVLKALNDEDVLDRLLILIDSKEK